MKEEPIFHQVLELPVEQRDAFLDAACGADVELRQRVAVLLNAQANPGSFLQSPAVGLAPTVNQPLADAPGTRIGPYKLLERIGEGGMGLVYMAEQQHPVRRLVALKVVKPGLDSRQCIARFEAERQALAMMDHPNIAQVLDAGTTESGNPYFVMELVRGIPINAFCDQKRLSVRERLKLFLEVCQAVQHAHQKGIIHRDIKPTNVLVTLLDVRAVPKVIDFGVAKALGQSLTEQTLHTGFAQLVGTPLYMSPEQAEMNQLGVDTRSDVYSLGVLLYELLIGTTPFDKDSLCKSGLDEMRRIIREDEPLRPSVRVSTLEAQVLSTVSQHRSTDPRQISTALRGELDWIVMKALEKDRSRRYESASAFAADVQRYLIDEPVLACPPTAMYRFQKFARKHKPAFVTALAVAACLLLGTTVSAWQAVRATEAEAQAEANEQKANANAATAQEKEQEAIKQRDEAKKQRDEVKALNDKLAVKEQQLQKTLYAAHMNLARHAWEAGRVNDVEELLKQYRPQAGESDRRGFEWHYLNRLCNSSLVTLRGHTGSVFHALYSPDGKRLVSASDDDTVRVWDAQSGQELMKLEGHPGDLAFSPDGARLVSCRGSVLAEDKNNEGRGLKVWDAKTWQVLLHQPEASGPVVYSPDGKQLATGYRSDGPRIKGIKIWDAQTGQEIVAWKAHDGLLRHLAYSPDGKRLASASHFPYDLKVWDAQTGRELLTLKDAGDSVEFSPDGKQIASSSQDGMAKMWDVATGQEVFSHNNVPAGWGQMVTLSPDGKRMATSNWRSTTHILDLQTRREIRTIKGAGSKVVFSPDGRRLASFDVIGSADYTVTIWNAEEDQDHLSIPHGRSVAYSPDGRYIASPSRPNSITMSDAATLQPLLTFEGHTAPVHAVAFSPDGKRLASGANGRVTDVGIAWGPDVPIEVKIWDVQTGQVLQSIVHERTSEKWRQESVHSSLAFSPDGKHLASTCKVWDAATGQELFSIGVNQSGRGNSHRRVAYSPDGKYLATGAFDGDNGNEVKLWNAQTGELVRTFTGGGQGVAFSPDNKRLASIAVRPDAKVWVWDVATGKELYSVGGDGGVAIAFSHDGTRLASGRKLWDAETGQELFAFEAISAGGYGVAFSPDGHRLASVTGGSTIIWDATPLPEKP